jgi:RNA polymerase sigma-54 factor
VIGYVRRAQWLLQALDQRRRTLKRIADLLVSLEGPFFEHGVEALVPLTRKALAHRLAVSPSTVSRALAGKHLLTPGGDVVSFDLFFDRSLPAKELMHRLLEREDQARPLSDGEMASRLAGQGVPWARRTVAKYREELGVLSRSQRGRKR